MLMLMLLMSLLQNKQILDFQIEELYKKNFAVKIIIAQQQYYSFRPASVPSLLPLNTFGCFNLKYHFLFCFDTNRFHAFSPASRAAMFTFTSSAKLRQCEHKLGPIGATLERKGLNQVLIRTRHLSGFINVFHQLVSSLSDQHQVHSDYKLKYLSQDLLWM